MKKSKAGTKKKEIPRPISTKSKCNNNKHNMKFYNIWKTYNEIQLTKNKIYLNIRKMKNHPPSPDIIT